MLRYKANRPEENCHESLVHTFPKKKGMPDPGVEQWRVFGHSGDRGQRTVANHLYAGTELVRQGKRACDGPVSVRSGPWHLAMSLVIWCLASDH